MNTFRVNKKIKRFRQFTAAAKTAWKSGAKLDYWLLLKSLLRRKDTSPGSLWWQRMKRGCLKCPIYCSARLTCGNGSDDLGCLCFMPAKAAMREATCWAQDQGLDIGWTEPRSLIGEMFQMMHKLQAHKEKAVEAITE